MQLAEGSLAVDGLAGHAGSTSYHGLNASTGRVVS